MTPRQGQALLVAAAGISLAALALALGRRNRLTLRYTLGWMFVAVCIVVSSALSGLVQPLARAVDVTETGLLLAAASTILLLITVQLSISVSGLQQLNQRLAESHALLEQRVRSVEDQIAATDRAAPHER